MRLTFKESQPKNENCDSNSDAKEWGTDALYVKDASPESVAERLHRKQQEYKKRIEHKRAIQEQKETLEMRNVPKINKSSRRMLRGKSTSTADANVVGTRTQQMHEHPAPSEAVAGMLAWQRDRDQRIEKMRAEKHRQEMESLRTKPRLVNSRSQQILENKEKKSASESTMAQEGCLPRRATNGGPANSGETLSRSVSVADRLIAQGRAYQESRAKKAAEALRTSRQAKPILATSNRSRPTSQPQALEFRKSKHAASKQMDPVGERLYKAAQDGAQRRLIQKWTQEHAQKEKAAAGAFRPKINKKSQQILARSKRFASSESVENRLLAHGANYQKRQKQREKKEIARENALHSMTVASPGPHGRNSQEDYIRNLQRPIGHVKEFTQSTIEKPTFAPKLNAVSHKLGRKADLRAGLDPTKLRPEEMTFLRNQQWAKRTEEKIEARKLQEAQMGQADCTFEPELVSNASFRTKAQQQQAYAASESGGGGDLASRSQYWLREKDRKTQEMRMEAEAKVVEGCTFNPLLVSSNTCSASQGHTSTKVTSGKPKRVRFADEVGVAEMQTSRPNIFRNLANTASGVAFNNSDNFSYRAEESTI